MYNKICYCFERIRAFCYFSFRREIEYGGKGRIERFFTITCEDSSNVHIGKGFYSRSNVIIHSLKDAKIEIGDNCFLNHNCSITAMESITIGNGCTFGNNVVIVDHDHDYYTGKGFSTSSVYIGKHVWVGANTVILQGSNIGDHCVIAAGSVIKGCVPPNTLVYQKRETITKEIVKKER